MGADGPGYEQKLRENAEKLKKESGLHVCGRYNNLVRFGELCEGCPHACKTPRYSKD
jgi:hypothetical protein